MINWMSNINNPKEVGFFMFFVIILMMVLLLVGCSTTKQQINFYQTDYGDECLYTPYTDSYKNLLFCYQESQSKEHIQNHTTNAIAKGKVNE